MTTDPNQIATERIAELCGEGEPPVTDPALARVSAALAEARLLLRELAHRRTGALPSCST